MPITLPPLFKRLLSARPSGQCAICRSWGPGRVCPACLARFVRPGPRCQRCALVVGLASPVCGACLLRPPDFDSAVAAVDYGHPWDSLILQFKFKAALDLCPVWVGLLHTAVLARQRPLPALLMPMPLSRQRLRSRGFNQAWEITRRLGPALGLACSAGGLLRIKDTPHQLALQPQQRQRNVQDAFALQPRWRERVQGLHVAVIDDVMTSGASGNAVAAVLKKAGAATVDLWTVARTPRPGGL